MFSNFKEKEELTVACSTNTNNCCTAQPKGKIECPKCNQKAKGVLEKTLNNLLNKNTKEKIICLSGFYYCKTPSCEVVYFRDNQILTQKNMNIIVGLKKDAQPATVCYCFDWTKEKIKNDINQNGKTTALEDIKNKMNTIGCSCEILNPSGGCCLGDVSQAIKDIKIQYELN